MPPSLPIPDIALDDRLGFVGTAGSGKTAIIYFKTDNVLGHKMLIWRFSTVFGRKWDQRPNRLSGRLRRQSNISDTVVARLPQLVRTTSDLTCPRPLSTVRELLLLFQHTAPPRCEGGSYDEPALLRG